MKFGRFEIDGIALAIISFVAIVICVTLVSSKYDIKRLDMQQQELKVQEIQLENERLDKEIQLKQLEEKDNG